MIKGVLCLMIILGSIAIRQRYTSYKIQQNLKNNLIRFHVRANSDSRFDQVCKLKVRDAVINQISPELENVNTKEELSLHSVLDEDNFSHVTIKWHLSHAI